MLHHRGKCIAIEYESTLKSSQRYREIFLHYALENQVDKVFYVVDSDEMIGKLSRQKFRHKIYLTTIQDLQEHQLNAKITGIDGVSSLQDFLGDRPNLDMPAN